MDYYSFTFLHSFLGPDSLIIICMTYLRHCCGIASGTSNLSVSLEESLFLLQEGDLLFDDLPLPSTAVEKLCKRDFPHPPCPRPFFLSIPHLLSSNL